VIGRRLATAVIQVVALALIVAATFALVVLGIGDVPTSSQWTLLLFAALAAIVAALVYTRLRPRIAAWSKRLLDREAGVPDDVARAFARRAAGGLPLEELLVALVETLRAGFAASRAEVWTSGAGALQLAAADPPRDDGRVPLSPSEEAALGRASVVGRAWLALWLPTLVATRPTAADIRAVPLTHAGELIGLLLAERAPGRAVFAKSDDEPLALLGRQAALALRNVRLGSALDESMEELRRQAEALRESRARVVVAADAERRRIERNLHDGAQQHLLGLAVNLKVARELQSADPERSAAILAELSNEVHAALDELRDLAHGIYPPLLAERGLADAIRTALTRSGLAGSVRADGIGRHPADVEATIYFCCVEAIQNAAKQSADAVSVNLWEEAGEALMFEVADDGPGFEPGQVAEGTGLTNMRDRVGALGGTLKLDASPGTGVRVTGAVPVVSPRALRGTAARP
jgi:signal transduction histidine kinase